MNRCNRRGGGYRETGNRAARHHLGRAIARAARHAAGAVLALIHARPAGAARRDARFEALEGRQLLSSATLVNGVLNVNGDSTTRNTIQVEAVGTTQVVAKHNGKSNTFARSAVRSIVVRGGNLSDYLAVNLQLTQPATIYCGGGNDTVFSGGGNDTIWGGAGNDSLGGRNGNDVLYGEDGNDTLDGGNGSDRTSGGTGTNVTRYAEGTATPPTQGGSTGGSTGSGTGGSTGSTGGSTGSTGGTGTDPLPGTGSTGTPDALISTISTSIPAGHAFHVNALSSTLNGGTPLTARYEWNFGDPNGKYNTLVGWNAAHKYKSPGTYTVTLRVTNEGGKSDTFTRQVTVTSENRRAIYVSAAGSDSNSGTSPTSPVRTLGRVQGMIGGGNVSVFFRRGDTFSLSNTFSVTSSNVALGAYGTGALPVMFYNGPRIDRPMFFTSGNDIAFSDLSFTTQFNDLEKSNMPDAINIAGRNTSIESCVFLNVGTAINTNADPVGVMALDNSAPSDVGIRSYFAWVEGTDHVYLGNRVANSTREHVLRISRNATRMLISGNEFTNRSRVSAGDRYDVAKNSLTVQWGNYAYVSGNKLRQGPVRVGPLGDADGWEAPQARFNYAVFEANLFEAPAFVQHGASHIIFRNNVSQAHGYGAYSVEGFNSAYNRGVTNLTFVNNTVNNGSDRGQFLKVEGPVNGINLVNNLYAAPNLTPGAYQAAPVFVAEGSLSSFRTITNNVWSPGRPLGYAEGGANYVWGVWSSPTGYRTEAEWNALPQVGTDTFSNTSIDSRFAPSSTSVAANAGRLYGGVFVDYYGKVRPATGAWSAGAVEV